MESRTACDSRQMEAVKPSDYGKVRTMTFSLKREYDLIASLGGNCAAACQMKHRGLRKVALGFDWLAMDDLRTIRYLADALNKGFADLALRENLKVCLPPIRSNGRKVCRYVDVLTGYRFLHLFHGEVETDLDEYKRGRATLFRRIDRFMGLLGKAKTALLVLETNFEFDDSEVEKLHEAISQRFPFVDIELYVMMFSSRTQGDRILPGIGVVCRYQRPVDLNYDMQLTSWEWSFLDYVKLAANNICDCPLRPTGMLRLKYKLWKHCGKELEDRGYPYVAMRFFNGRDVSDVTALNVNPATTIYTDGLYNADMKVQVCHMVPLSHPPPDNPARNGDMEERPSRNAREVEAVRMGRKENLGSLQPPKNSPSSV